MENLHLRIEDPSYIGDLENDVDSDDQILGDYGVMNKRERKKQMSFSKQADILKKQRSLQFKIKQEMTDQQKKDEEEIQTAITKTLTKDKRHKIKQLNSLSEQLSKHMMQFIQPGFALEKLREDE